MKVLVSRAYPLLAILGVCTCRNLAVDIGVDEDTASMTLG